MIKNFEKNTEKNVEKYRVMQKNAKSHLFIYDLAFILIIAIRLILHFYFYISLLSV